MFKVGDKLKCTKHYMNLSPGTEVIVTKVRQQWIEVSEGQGARIQYCDILINGIENFFELSYKSSLPVYQGSLKQYNSPYIRSVLK